MIVNGKIYYMEAKVLSDDCGVIYVKDNVLKYCHADWTENRRLKRGNFTEIEDDIIAFRKKNTRCI
jgi:hypothetical protein